MKITIGHLYPDLLNLYGDRGNIQCMMKRCQWRGIEAETLEFKLEDEVDFSKLDIVLLGGGSDREQMIVCKRLQQIQKNFKDYVEDGGVVIAVCGGYQLLGDYYQTDEGRMEGLHLVKLHTEQKPGRLIRKVISLICRLSGLRIMADVPISVITSRLAKSCMVPETTVNPAMKVLYTSM